MTILRILVVITSIAAVAVIMMQPSKGEGLGAIGGGGQMFFARNKGLEKMREKLTAWLVGIFFVLALVMGALDK